MPEPCNGNGCNAGRMTEDSGRRSRSTRLDRLVEAVQAGQGRALVVRGDPGMGKTVMLDYLAGRASDTGCRVFRGTASS
jgi:DNA replication protein DnaC